MSPPFLPSTTLHLLRLSRGALSLLDQLALEEALFRADTRNWLVLARGPAAPTIVLGLSGRAEALVDGATARAAGVGAIRRFTGGGTVVADADSVLVSFICNGADAGGAPLFPRDVMAWSASLYAPVFQGLLTGGRAPAAPFHLVEHDYCLGARKFGGNAQAVSRGRWVHHTSFLWDFAPANMALLHLPAKRPDYRRDRAHGDFLTRLVEHVPRGTPHEALGDAVAAHLDATGVRIVEASLADALAVLPLNERRSNEVAW